MRGKPTRLKASLLAGSDELVYLCLPDWFRSALLSLTERMLWTRVWTDDNGDEHILSSSEKTRIEYGIYRLMVDGCEDEELQEMIDEIISRLEELENMNINVNCGCGCGCGGGCGGGCGHVAENELLPTDPPLGGAQPPDDSEDILNPSGDKCARANWMYDQIKATAQLGTTAQSRQD